MAIEFKDGKYVDANGHVTLDPTKEINMDVLRIVL